MRKYLMLVMPACIFFSVSIAQSPAQIKALIEKPWAGLAQQPADFTQSGKLTLEISISLTLNSDNTVTGVGSSSFRMDGVTYTRKVKVKGNYIPNTWSVRLEDDEVISASILPSGLRWCKEWGTLSFFTDPKRPGYYIFSGDKFDDCGGKTITQYSDNSDFGN